MSLREQAERDAAEVLSEAGLTDIWDMPVDATRLAERLGANVFQDDLSDEGLDGFILIFKNSEAEITINSAQSLNRRRFTCAHELGHYWQERSKRQRVGFVDNSDSVVEDMKLLRDEKARAGTSPPEIYANAFAAALLMPKQIVTDLHKVYPAWRLARFFGVSEAAMNYRLANLGLV